MVAHGPILLSVVEVGPIGDSSAGSWEKVYHRQKKLIYGGSITCEVYIHPELDFDKAAASQARWRRKSSRWLN